MNYNEKLKLTIRGYKLIHKLIPNLIPSAILLGIFRAALPFVNIIMSANIINAIAKSDDFNHIMFLAILTAFLNVLIAIISSLLQKWFEYNESKSRILYNKLIKDKLKELDYELIEDKDTHVEVEKIRMYNDSLGAGLRKLVYVCNSLDSVFKIIYSVVLIGSIFTSHHLIDARDFEFIFSPLATIGIIGLVIVNTIVLIRSQKNNAEKMYLVNEEVAPMNQIYHYYFNNILTYNALKDIKLNNLDKSITKELSKIEDLTIYFSKTLTIHQSKIGLIVNVVNIIVTAIFYIFVGLKALFGAFSIGSIVQYVGVLIQFNEGISKFTTIFSFIDTNAPPLKTLFMFLDKPNVKYNGTLPVEKRVFCDDGDNEYEVEFKNVSFKYPKSDNFALKNINLKINIGKKLAVVGMNGSGKTTLIKLLCRLYDPTEGEITLNGVNIKKYDYEEYMSIFAVVFQDFKLFSFNIAQNVAGSVNYNEEMVNNALSDISMLERVNEMDNKIQTHLYKDFKEDGIEISGGEAQKIAFARALYKKAPFIILDEPTAALDPIMEYEIYSNFNELVKDKTTIYISHRLSSCKFCDEIVVFNNGEIVQKGNHETLILEKDKKYQELWNAQAKYYT